MPLWFRSAIFTLVFPGTLAGVVPWLLATGARRLPLSLGSARWLGILPLALGLLTYGATTGQFASVGGGTPAPWDPPLRLVRSGLHAWVRNPMYLGVLLCILGEGLLAQSGILFPYAAVVWAVFHIRVLSYEEPVLRRLFGAAFEDYVRQVPRWLPRRPPANPSATG
jgi:protein-S-isoprenylcysteine O-methyltransferase Ste14